MSYFQKYWSNKLNKIEPTVREDSRYSNITEILYYIILYYILINIIWVNI